MKPLETLTNEHGLIRQFLDNMTHVTHRIEKGEKVSIAFFEKAVDFARGFADDYHHFKEEHVLFVRLAQKKSGEIDAQLDALRQQHERGRAFVSGMSKALEGYVDGDPMKTVDLLENASAYCALLRHHIHIEDHVFYPMAKKALSAEDMAEVNEEFDRQREKHGLDTFEKYHKLVVDMGSIIVHMQ
jgi:hemerythrin-like domain-containing protein